MKFGTFRYEPQESLKNLYVAGEAKVLQLSLAQGKQLRKHRNREASLCVVRRGIVTVDVGGRTTVLHPDDTLFLEPGEQHSLQAEQDALLLLVLLPMESAMGRMTTQDFSTNWEGEDWKAKITPELRVLAESHERILAVTERFETFEMAAFDEALDTLSKDLLDTMQFEEEQLFPLLSLYLGGDDVGPIPRLLTEHRNIREALRRCQTARQALDGGPDNIPEMFDFADRLVGLLWDHFEKEDFHLLPMAGRLLDSDQRSQLLQQWRAATCDVRATSAASG